MNGIEKITEHILNDAKTSADETLNAANAAADETAKKYAALAADIRRRCTDEANRDAQGIIERASASGTNVKRNMLLGVKAELIDKAFEEAARSVLSLDGESYLAFLTKVLNRALADSVRNEDALCAEYGDEFERTEVYELRLNAADREKFGEALLAAGNSALAQYGKTIKLGTLADIDGGFILRSGDVEENCSLSVMIASVRASLEPQVSSVLFGQ